jgi:hypothetical protein
MKTVELGFISKCYPVLNDVEVVHREMGYIMIIVNDNTEEETVFCFKIMFLYFPEGLRDIQNN